MSTTTTITTPERVELQPQPTAVVRFQALQEELSAHFDRAYAATVAAIEASGARVAGPPFARYLSVGPVFEVEAGFPFVGTIDPSDPVAISALPGGAALTCRYVGDYDGLGGAWHELDAWREKAGMAAAGPCWESYLTDPREPGPPVTLLVEPLV